MEIGVEIGKILPHLDRRFENADLFEFLGSVMDRFRKSGVEIEGHVPCTQIGRVKAAAIGRRVTERRHDRRCMGPTDNPIVCGNHTYDAEFRHDTIVGPALELKNEFEVFGQRHHIEDTYRRVPAGDQPMGIFLLKPGNRRRQFQAPRRASSRRRVL